MTRVVKTLPADRADWTFGGLVYWHFFIYGTRPDGDPADDVGRVWRPKEVFHALGLRSANAFWNWVADRHYPHGTAKLEDVLFGTSRLYAAERLELQEKLRLARAPVIENGEVKAAAPPVNGTGFILIESDEPGVAKEPDDKTTGDGAEGNGSLVAMPSVEPDQESQNDPTQDTDSEGGHLVVWQMSDVYRPSGYGNPPPPRGGTLTIGESIRLHWWASPHRDDDRRPRRKWPALVAGLAVLIGAYGVIRLISPYLDRTLTSQPERLPPLPEQKDAPKPEQKVEQPPPKEPTEAEKRAAEDKRVREATVRALEERQQKQAAAERQAAIQSDADQQAAEKAQRERTDNARRVAGMGFHLIENNSVTGTSIGYVRTDTVEDCALACLRDQCDAFAYFKDSSDKHKFCYRFKEPLTFFTHPGYTAGRRVNNHGSSLPVIFVSGKPSEGPILLAQAAGHTPPMASDGVVDCSSGPVKVSGYNLTCDAYLGGGKTLGSARLTYSVANVNQCAAKCSAVKGCTAFTFNAADQSPAKRCEIFGGAPEKRTANGWISGER